MSEFKQCGTQAQQMSSSSGGSAAIEDFRPAVQQQEDSTVSKLSASHVQRLLGRHRFARLLRLARTRLPLLSLLLAPFLSNGTNTCFDCRLTHYIVPGSK